MNYEGLYTVAGPGHGGGLALFWKQEGKINVISSSHNFIDAEVHLDNMEAWRLICYYGFPERSRRRDSWNLLRNLSTKSSLPWVILGDFNDILRDTEKKGRHKQPNWLINGFKDAMFDCGVTDLPLEGHQFTWERSKGTNRWVEEKLDRVFVSDEWRDRFPTNKVQNLIAPSSDHSALYLQVQIWKPVPRRARFRFENSWLREKWCSKIVQECWQKSRDNNIEERIDLCAKELKSWGDMLSKKFKDNLSKCRERMERFRGNTDTFSQQCYLAAMKEYTKMLSQQEDFWKQRAKQHWLKNADNNTKYFHVYASARKKKNQITQLKDDNGRWCDWKQGLGEIVGKYYDKLFHSNEVVCDEVIESIGTRINSEQNEKLSENFTVEEVKRAIFSMHPDKSPGPDGMNPAFYQRFCEIIGNDISSACINILSTNQIPVGLNDTLVVLIPKKNTPETVNDLRPISLCNVMMKIITKMLANRMKDVLSSVISEMQSAFIPGRLITDNVIAAFEVNHWMKKKTQGKMGISALKLDMSKAYDRVEWNFIMAIMQKMGFSRKWITWIHFCMTSVKYNFLVSGHEVGPIVPSRGLRQGDPISPYLFLLCTEGLSTLIQRKQLSGALHGCKIANSAPIVSHLFFADDCYLFFRATVPEAQCIKDCLSTYESATGQQVNFQKSSISFSCNTAETTKEAISQLLQVPIRNDGSYLGLPKTVGGNKRAVFGYIKDKAWNRMQSWKGKSISRAGKEILLKSVIQAIPSYVASIFLLPMSLCEDIERLMNKFWWLSDMEKKNGIRWMAWDRMCYPKKNGGMGFKKIREFNVALLGKQIWRLLTVPNSFVARLLKARYFPSCSVLNAGLGNNPSYVWRSILAAKDLISSGSILKVGNGESINIWEDPWIPEIGCTKIRTALVNGLEDAKVSALLKMDANEWDFDLLKDIFDQEDVEKILKIPISLANHEDKWLWLDDDKGQYTVKSGYRTLSRSFPQSLTGTLSFKWLKLWNLAIPPKVKNFMWRALHDCLPTLENLRRKSVKVQPICQICKIAFESLDHALFSCPFANRCWEVSTLTPTITSGQSTHQMVTTLFDVLSMKDLELFCSVLWSLWNHRNSVVWNNRFKTCSQVVNEASSSLFQWQEAQVTQNRQSACFEHEGMLVWHPPPPGWKTCNVDAAFFENGNRSSYGCILRDESGTFIAGCGGRLIGALDPRVTEALACREALSWLKKLGIQNVYVELDSLKVVEAIRTQLKDDSYFGGIVTDCVNFLKDLRSLCVYFVRRSANSAAHAIARVASSMSGFEEWSSTPSFLIDVLAKDLNY